MAEEFDSGSGSVEEVKDLGLPPRSVVKRWVLELNLADKDEREWRKEAQEIWGIYRGKERKKNSFNILWANVETLRPAVYNSVPRPDVRRRFKTEDAPGRLAAQMLERGIAVSLDSYDFNGVMKAVVLDTLICGRGVPRVKYVPTFTPGSGTVYPMEDGEAPEQVTYEQAVCEHVNWEDFRHGPGKRWEEVTWIAFRHKMSRKQLVEKFGNLGKEVNLDTPEDDVLSKLDDTKIEDLFKRADIWEIWDKDEKKVIFISKSYKERPLQEIHDPLGLSGFFPTPEPLYAIEDTGTLIPGTLYEQYREQANELNRVSSRINVIINGLKLRGVYDSQLGGVIQSLMEGEDNKLIPTDDAVAFIERGGLDKAIWLMPIDMAAKVLEVLEASRERIKQTIYEITGIADIIRGATDPQETLGAQKIKSEWGSLRIQKIQKDVQRLARDLIRITAEIISEKFDIALLDQATDMNIAMQAQQGVQPLQAQTGGVGQTPPGQMGPVAPAPTLDQISQLMKSDAMRAYRIDIETDSTIQELAKQDQEEVTKLLQGIVEFLNGIAPAVQSGALPIEAVKALLMTAVRRFKLGAEVEDSLEGIQPPQAPPDQETVNAQAEAQAQEQRDRQTMELERAKLASTESLEREKIAFERQKIGMDPRNPEDISQIAAQSTQGLQDVAQQISQFMTSDLNGMSMLVRHLQSAFGGIQQANLMIGQMVGAQSQALADLGANSGREREHKLVRDGDNIVSIRSRVVP